MITKQYQLIMTIKQPHKTITIYEKLASKITRFNVPSFLYVQVLFIQTVNSGVLKSVNNSACSSLFIVKIGQFHWLEIR